MESELREQLDAVTKTLVDVQRSYQADVTLLRGALERLADDNTRRGLTSSQLSWARYVLLGGLAAWEGES